MDTRMVADKVALVAVGPTALGAVTLTLTTGKPGSWRDLTAVADGTRLVAPGLTVAMREGAPDCVISNGTTLAKVSGAHGVADLRILAHGGEAGSAACPVASTVRLESHYPVEELSPVRYWPVAP